MKQITVDFSKFGDIDEKHRPGTYIANALYEKNLGGNPIYLDEKTDIIYAPICTRDHFERFYGNVKENTDNGNMPIDDVILCLKGIKQYGSDTFTKRSQGDWQNSLDTAIETMRKYQKIQEIVENRNIKPPLTTLNRIIKVVEDGTV